jgi:hypothetical protein
LWFAAVGLAFYCVALTVLTGDIGFNGDDWWVLAVPYWNSFPESLVLYASKFLRPVEGVYWIGLFELFGFNKMAFHFCSLLMLVGSAILMGVALHKAFPERRDCISIAVLLAFFLPPVSCLTYVMFTDNSRLSMLLFWCSVIAFQRWAEKSSSWRGLAPSVALYVSSFLTYEASSFLIFVAPLLVWPVYQRRSASKFPRVFAIKLFAGIAIAFAAAPAIRFLLLNGGAVRHGFLFPPFELLWSYLVLLPFYLFAPFSEISSDRWAIAAGGLATVGTAGMLFFTRRDRPVGHGAAEAPHKTSSLWCLVTLGAGILLLGALPYQLAGYGSFSPRIIDTLMVKCGLLPQGDLSWFNFSWASRIYSSASFGAAILIGLALSAWRKPLPRALGTVAAVVVIGFMAIFHAGLSLDWKEAADIRNDLMRSLVTQAPAVKSGTNFVFLDVHCSHKRAEVIRRENGLRELVGMLYVDQTLGAWRLYRDAYDPSTQASQQAVAIPEGFLSRSQRQSEPAPHESLLLFKRAGREFILLDSISADDGLTPTGIAWQGVERIESNLARIEDWRTPISPDTRLARAEWTRGLIATLQLSLFQSTDVSIRRLRYIVVHDALRRRLVKTRHLDRSARTRPIQF